MKLLSFAKRVMAAACIAALMVTGTAQTASAAKIGKSTSSKTYIKSEDWPDGPSVDSKAAVLMDARTGTVLYAKNPDTLLYPASITKIMTALLTLENCNLDDKMTFKEEAVQSLPYNAVSIDAKKGEKMTIRECLSATLIYSANDAAAGLACEVGGTIKNFSKLMNARAKELGCKNTHFHNPHGLTDSKHWTTAYDMCLIMKECIKYKDFRKIASTRIYKLKKNNKRKKSFTFAAKHKMLFKNNAEYYKYVVCGKTGYTDEAGNTLITYAKKGNTELICCTMKGGYGVAYSDTKKLFEYGFDNFSTINASKKDTQFTADSLGINANNADVSIALADKSYVIVPKGLSISDLDTEINYLDNDADQYFAEVTYKYEGTTVGTTKLKMVLNDTGQTAEIKDKTVVTEETAETQTTETQTIENANESAGSTASDHKSATLTGSSKIGIAVAAGVILLAVILIIIWLIGRNKKSGGDPNKRRYQK